VRTLVGAAEPDDPDPACGFTAVSSIVPWLSETREPTIPLTRTATTSAGPIHPDTYNSRTAQ